MTELSFVEELPGIVRGKQVSKKRADELRTNAGRWAMWPSQSSTAVVRRILGDGFEVVSRNVNGKTRAFARFVGNPQAAGPPPQFLSAGHQQDVVPDLLRSAHCRPALRSRREGPGAFEAPGPQGRVRLGSETTFQAEVSCR